MITLALIGAGKWGKNYLKSCRDLPGIKISYICSKSRKTPKLEDLLNKKDISGFIIATPTSTHFEIAKLLIKKNKNVLIEKPVTDSLSKTKLLYDLSCKHPRAVVMAGHIQLYDSGYLKLKKNIVKIGRINTLKYEGLQSPKRKDVGVFWDWLPHPLYLFSDITQKIPKITSAKFIKPDNLKISVSLEKNVIGKIHVGWTYPFRKRSFVIIGEKGKISLKSISGKYTPLQNELLTFAQCIREKTQPPSSLKQAMEIAKTITKIEELLNI